MNKILKKVLIVVGIVLAVLLVAGTGIFFYVRSRFMGPSIEIKAADNSTVASTEYGDVKGYISDSGIYTYHGIPYAEAKERFVVASEPEHWDGVLDATEYGKISPQGAILGMSVSESDNADNNSQNLNVWTPGLDGEKRPVMVWLHGGGFSMGSANDSMYDGTNLAKYQDVVVVGVNHRLNIYGYLDLTAYGEKYEHSDNVGMMDIIQSLEWIHDNIEQFGGDPDNITVFGQSGGGAKVLSLMTSPYAKGKFQKAIVQSGATETMGVTFSTKEASLALTESILSELGITEANIEDIQTVSNMDLQNAASKALKEVGTEFKIPESLGNGYNMEWGPVIDGDFMPTNPVTEDGFGQAGADVPLLIGSNLEEWAAMGGLTHEKTDELTKAYKAAYPNEDAGRVTNVDSFIRLPMLKIMAHKADQNGADVYGYVFTKQEIGYGSYHGAEISYVFHNSSSSNGLNELMSSIWGNFARTGVPSAKGLDTWEPYTRDGEATMILDEKSYLTHAHDTELMHILEPDYIW